MIKITQNITPPQTLVGAGEKPLMLPLFGVTESIRVFGILVYQRTWIEYGYSFDLTTRY